MAVLTSPAVEFVTIAGVVVPVSDKSSSVTWPETVDFVTYGDRTPLQLRQLADDPNILPTAEASSPSSADKEKVRRPSSSSHGSTQVLSDIFTSAVTRPVELRRKI